MQLGSTASAMTRIPFSKPQSTWQTTKTPPESTKLLKMKTFLRASAPKQHQTTYMGKRGIKTVVNCQGFQHMEQRVNGLEARRSLLLLSTCQFQSLTNRCRHSPAQLTVRSQPKINKQTFRLHETSTPTKILAFGSRASMAVSITRTRKTQPASRQTKICQSGSEEIQGASIDLKCQLKQEY